MTRARPRACFDGRAVYGCGRCCIDDDAALDASGAGLVCTGGPTCRCDAGCAVISTRRTATSSEQRPSRRRVGCIHCGRCWRCGKCCGDDGGSSGRSKRTHDGWCDCKACRGFGCSWRSRQHLRCWQCSGRSHVARNRAANASEPSSSLRQQRRQQRLQPLHHQRGNQVSRGPRCGNCRSRWR